MIIFLIFLVGWLLGLKSKWKHAVKEQDSWQNDEIDELRQQNNVLYAQVVESHNAHIDDLRTVIIKMEKIIGTKLEGHQDCDSAGVEQDSCVDRCVNTTN